MINWVIKRLGGITQNDLSEIMDYHEKWALENLVDKDGGIIPDCSFYSPFYGGRLCILKSRTSVLPGELKSFKVAPWCREVVATGLIILES